MRAFCLAVLLCSSCAGAGRRDEGGDALLATKPAAHERSSGEGPSVPEGASTRATSEGPTPQAPTVPGSRLAPVSPQLSPGTFHGWCRHGGAPPVGKPLLDNSGRVFSLTSDGYLHAYERDGRYRFSYTVSGTPLGSPSLRPGDGAVLLGTTAGLIYAINSQGGLYFRARTVTPVWSGLYPLDKTAVVYLGLDRRLYALSNFGGALYRVLLPGQPSGEPEIGADGIVWVPLDRELARVHRALSLIKVTLPESIERVVALGTGAVVLAGKAAFWVDRRGTVTSLGDVAAVFGDDHGAVLLGPTGNLSEVTAAGTVQDLALTPKLRAELGASLPEDGAVSGRRLYLPRDDGQVLVVDRAASPATGRLVASGTERIATIVARGNILAVVSRGGSVCVSSL